MSYTEIYKFGKDGNAELFAEVKNSFRGAMAVWNILEKKYLPKYIPEWAMGDTSREYSRSSDFFGKALKEVWDLFYSDKISENDKVVLGSTFDNVIVMRNDIPMLIESFRCFEGETSLKEQSNIIERIYNDNKTFIAIAWNQTSVNGDAWESDEIMLDEEDEEFYLPYNILKENKHWNLFESIYNQINNS